MERGWQKARWDHTAVLQATQLNCRIGVKRWTRAIDVHPYRRGEGGEVIKVDFAKLVQVMSKQELKAQKPRKKRGPAGEQ